MRLTWEKHPYTLWEHLDTYTLQEQRRPRPVCICCTVSLVNKSCQNLSSVITINKGLITNASDDFSSFYFSEKIRLDIACES